MCRKQLTNKIINRKNKKKQQNMREDKFQCLSKSKLKMEKKNKTKLL